MDRRTFLQSTAATAVAAVIPAIPILAAPVAPAPALGPAWAVGTPGDWDWDVIRATTESEAIAYWKKEQFGFVCDCNNMPHSSRRCDGCSADACADRKPKWDNVPGDATWFNSWLGTHCSRCSYETFRENGGWVVGKEIVCEHCMRLADYETVDPEHAAELREDAA